MTDYTYLDAINDEIDTLMLENAKTGKKKRALKKAIKSRDNMIKHVDVKAWWKHEEARLEEKENKKETSERAQLQFEEHYKKWLEENDGKTI